MPGCRTGLLKAMRSDLPAAAGAPPAGEEEGAGAHALIRTARATSKRSMSRPPTLRRYRPFRGQVKVDWRRDTMSARGLPDSVAITAFGVLVLLVWEGAVRALSIPRLLVPAPSQIAQALVAGLVLAPFAANGLLYNGLFTLGEAFGGFLIGSAVGILLGALLSQSRTLEELLLPYIVAFQSMPRIALAPLVLVWVGLGPVSKLLIVFLVTFFPVFVNSLAGFRDADPERLELLRSLGASNWQMFRLVKLPNPLPMVFAGLDIALVYSLIGGGGGGVV